ncbi:CotD family spore coat protein [Halobacillus naozhouensis]|uniref:CotD family spore coat protein n=1 Tax=Halobacillus naozhouensis TaxID=554880 RepID=A0ABY8J6E8_9BACI|nr:CotD family spore coat protein [Halobacillus naozhouensis]WFT76476.1 CotD family spore coat protein [Halobacillus naozhouensis]
MGRYYKSRKERDLEGSCSPDQTSPAQEETIYYPTETVVNYNTNRRVVKHVRPTEVENVNRTIIRNENYYPVTNSEVNETVVEEYDCGSDINSPNCQRVSPSSTNNSGSNCGCHKDKG